MSIWNVIVLQVAAVVLGIVEALIPSLGLLGVAGLVVLGISWYLLLAHFSQEIQITFAVINAISVPFIIWFSFVALKRSPLNLSKQLELGDGKTSEENKVEGESLLHQIGTVQTPLNPTGTALFQDEIREVQSNGAMIQPGTEVQVVEIQGNIIRVAPTELPPK